jgi:hypothetical protein
VASWKINIVDSVLELERFLNGAIKGTVDLSSGADVDGKTFTIDVGSGGVDVDFTPSKSRLWTSNEIVSAINDADSSLEGIASLFIVSSAGINQRFLVLEKDGLEITVQADGTANEDLGFVAGTSPDDDTVGDPVADAELKKIFKDSEYLNKFIILTLR